MKQTSLLDSFIRRQQPTLNSREKDPPILLAPSESVQREHQEEQNAEKRISELMISSERTPVIGRQSFGVAHQEEQEIGQRSHKRKRMDIDDYSVIEEDYCHGPKLDDFNAGFERPNKPEHKNQNEEQEDIKNENRKSMGVKKGYSKVDNRRKDEDNQGFEFIDATPEWATKQNHRDAQGNRAGDQGYDPTTLFIPPEGYKSLTETMRQYWNIKKEHYDKIVMFKMGKFYEMFFDDSLVGKKELNLNFAGGKMHVGFPEKSLDRYTHELVQQGYKVVVVEQMETVDMMKERNKKEGRGSERTLAREITQVLTKGTFVYEGDEEQYLPNFLITVVRQQNTIGYALLEMGTNALLLGVSQSFEQFKTVLYQTRPSELLYDPDNLPNQLVSKLKEGWLQMILTPLPNRDNIWHPLNAQNEIERMVVNGELSQPKILETIKTTSPQHYNLVYTTISGLFRYLKNCLKFQYFMGAVKFGLYDHQRATSMVLDSQALQHLELFDTPLGPKHSLFHKIDRTSTKFGRRLLRKWLMQPLLVQQNIEQRLDAVQDLQRVYLDRQRVMGIFKTLPDLQRLINRLYHYSAKTLAEKAIYFQDVSANRLREFKVLVSNLRKSSEAIEILHRHVNVFRSHRLKRLLTRSKGKIQEGAGTRYSSSDIYEEKQQRLSEEQRPVHGLLPKIQEHLEQFDSYVHWENDTPVPQKGLVASYDCLQDELAASKNTLEEYLDDLRRVMRVVNLKFVHTKERYEIEVPEDQEKKNPSNFIFTSKRAGFSRYVTPESRKLVAEVESIEQKIKEQMGQFVGFFFDEFRKKQIIWEKYIAVLTEIDCLISLSVYSYQSGGVRPKFRNETFRIKAAKHPCLASNDLIPNNIVLDPKVMLLTGPNMGGKSTYLRTTCLLAILAQVGVFVLAQEYQAELIDRVFTRIGASDRLDEGKSTFFIEMQETKNVLEYGTQHSLAIMDQLGRGTSTFDGMAIAFAVLRQIVTRINCRCLFATHYHSLSQQFQGNINVQHCMMDYLIKDNQVIFLYKLRAGSSGQSFGINVAKTVKLPSSIIEVARLKTEAMSKQIAEKERLRSFRKALDFIL